VLYCYKSSENEDTSHLSLHHTGLLYLHYELPYRLFVQQQSFAAWDTMAGSTGCNRRASE
ncbi:MAG: hypothetical protein ACSW8H_00620, partial [bacterium]